MPFSVQVHHTLPFLLVQASGPAGLADLCGCADMVAGIAQRKGYRRALLDLHATQPQLSFTDHLQLGTHVAAALAALQRVATVISVENRSGASEKAAQKSGLALRTFTDHAQARGWIEEA
jgi:hypothetical protein